MPRHDALRRRACLNALDEYPADSVIIPTRWKATETSLRTVAHDED
jgi:hypothetical protein